MADSTRALFCTVPAFRFSIGPLDRAIGKWSRGATFGSKAAKGEGLDFNVASLSQMVDNAAARGDKISICADHLSVLGPPQGIAAPSLGFFYALALFVNGECVKHWAYDGGAPPPGVDDEGNPRDGLYCRLGEITPRGMDPLEGLANYSCLSPTFPPPDKATDEAGNPIGYALIDFAATSAPFQSGCELQLHQLPTDGATAMAYRVDGTDYLVEQYQGGWRIVSRSGKQQQGGFQSRAEAEQTARDMEKVRGQEFSVTSGARRLNNEVPMNEQMLSKLGLAADADDAARMAALKQFAANAATQMAALDPAACGAMAADLETFAEIAADEDKAQMKALAAKFKKMGAPDAEPEHKEPDGDEVQAMSALASSLAARGVKVPAGASRAVLMSLAAAQPANADEARIAALVDARMKAQRDADERQAREQEAAQLVAMARTAKAPEHEIVALGIVAKSDIATAREMAKKYGGSATPPAHLFGRLTAQGAPVTMGKSAREERGTIAPPSIHSTPFGDTVAPDEALADEIKRFANSTDPADVAALTKKLGKAPDKALAFDRLAAANEIVMATRPDLVDAARRVRMGLL